MLDTYLVDGTDIRDGNVRFVSELGGAFSSPNLRGNPVSVVGRDGVVYVEQFFDSNTFTLALTILGDTVADVNEAIRAVKALLLPTEQVTLTRRQEYSGGIEDHTAAAQYLSYELAVDLDGLGARMAVSWTLLDGLWYGDTDTVGVGAVNVLGDVRTHRMTIALPNGAGPITIANTRTGHQFTYTGATNGVVIDVEAMTADHLGTDVSHNLTWTKMLPFQLAPGAQTITSTAGAPVITYAPAFQ